MAIDWLTYKAQRKQSLPSRSLHCIRINAMFMWSYVENSKKYKKLFRGKAQVSDCSEQRADFGVREIWIQVLLVRHNRFVTMEKSLKFFLPHSRHCSKTLSYRQIFDLHWKWKEIPTAMKSQVWTKNTLNIWVVDFVGCVDYVYSSFTIYPNLTNNGYMSLVDDTSSEKRAVFSCLVMKRKKKRGIQVAPFPRPSLELLPSFLSEITEFGKQQLALI